MNPERRNQLALTAITWLVTVAGILTAVFAGQVRARSDGNHSSGDEVIVAFVFPVVAIVVGLIACFERPRSGVKRSVSFLGLLPVFLSSLVLAGAVWLYTTR